MSPGVTTFLKPYLRGIANQRRPRLPRPSVDSRLGNQATVVPFAAHDEDGPFFLFGGESRKRGVALDDHVGIYPHVQQPAQLLGAGLLGLAAAVGEKDEGDALRLEVQEGLVGARDWGAAAQEHAVDAAARR